MADQQVQTIRSQIYKILRSSLWKGEYAPGQRLQEVELANQLHVSRSPVREALRQLTADGLVIEVPNKGIYVKEFTVRDIDEIFDVRLMMETYAIRGSSPCMTDGQRSLLIDLSHTLEETYDSGDLDRYAAADSELHKQIVRLGNNSLVEDLYYRVRSMNQQFRVRSLNSHNRFHESIFEHRDIITALVTGDVEKAVQVNSLHLERACSCIKEQLAMNPPEHVEK
ncbi:MAG: GntR family transcriptional regulator [Lawsonibacter sp.]|nr:GntR family transcriptional regulator [Lawsonibacter sp.]